MAMSTTDLATSLPCANSCTGTAQASIPRLALGLLLLCVLVLLTACGGSQQVCSRSGDAYLAARDNPPLRVPDGFSQPPRLEALAIPELKENRQASAGRSGCLDEPPSYFRASGITARTPEEVVASWAQAWANREADAVIALYSNGFAAPTDSAGGGVWLEQRHEQVAVGPVPDPALEGIKVEPDGEDRRIVTFVQKFGANALRKELVLVRESGSWRIAAENVVEVR